MCARIVLCAPRCSSRSLGALLLQWECTTAICTMRTDLSVIVTSTDLTNATRTNLTNATRTDLTSNAMRTYSSYSLLRGPATPYTTRRFALLYCACPNSTIRTRLAHTDGRLGATFCGA